MVSNWGYSCLATLVFCGVTVNWLPGIAVVTTSYVETPLSNININTFV